MIDDYKLLDLLTEDILVISNINNKLWAEGVLKEESIDSTELHRLPFTHRHHMSLRLNFFRQLLMNSNKQLQ